jgi:hypothetical protein
VLNLLLEALTRPEKGPTAGDLPHYRMVNGFYKNPGELLERLLATAH